MYSILFGLIIACSTQPTQSSNKSETPQPFTEEAIVPLKEQGALVIPTQETLGSLNVHSSRFGIVYRSEEGCYVDVETTSLNVPSASNPEAIQALECTPFMNDNAWQQCLLKEIYRAELNRCICKMPGAPIDQGTETPCPSF